MLPLIPLAITMVPEIAKWLFGDSAVVAKTTGEIATVLRSVTGADPTTDEGMAAVSAVLAAKPDLALQVRVQLAQIAAAREKEQRDADNAAFSLQLADVKNARDQTLALANMNSRVQWAAPTISAVVLLTFAVVIVLAFTRPIPAGAENLGTMLIGALASMASSVVAYWVGSSNGSARKTEMLYRSTPPSNAGAMP